jgi:hypothetical protein
MSFFTEMDFNCFSYRAGRSCRTSYSSAPFGTFAAHKMTATAASSADFTGSSNFDSFAQTLVGFPFRHLIDSLNIKETVYSIYGCWSIPQFGISRKKMKNQLTIFWQNLCFYTKVPH